MSQITTIIGQQAFEIIRDRICEILTDEISNQFALTQDSNLNLKVWKERSVPFDHSELPAVNVQLVRGEAVTQDAKSTDDTYTFFIECHSKAKSTDDENGDVKATLRNHRITGVVRAILHDARYITLGIEAPFIINRRVQSIEFAMVETATDTLSIAPSRISFAVKVPEKVDLKSVRIIEGFQTQLKLNETENGFFYSS